MTYEDNKVKKNAKVKEYGEAIWINPKGAYPHCELEKLDVDFLSRYEKAMKDYGELIKKI